MYLSRTSWAKAAAGREITLLTASVGLSQVPCRASAAKWPAAVAGSYAWVGLPVELARQVEEVRGAAGSNGVAARSARSSSRRLDVAIGSPKRCSKLR